MVIIFLHHDVKLFDSIFVVECVKSYGSAEAKLRAGDGEKKRPLAQTVVAELSCNSMSHISERELFFLWSQDIEVFDFLILVFNR